MKRLRSRLPFGRPTASTVIALIALFVALGGTGYATHQLARNSVGAAQIRSNAVGASEIRARAVGTSELRNGAVRAEDLAPGVTTSGPPGAQGERGPEGPPGPSTGPAGGDLAGSYPNPTLRNGAVTPARISGIPAVRVEQARTDDQTIPNAGNGQNIAFGTEIFDTDGMFDPAANTRITFRTAGVYVVTGAARWLENANGVRTIGLIPEDDFLQFLAADTRNNNGTQPVRQSVSAVACFPANSFIVLRAIQNSGGNLNIDNADSPQVHLAATWVAPQPAGGCPYPFD
jgi:hypothetical protein